MRDFEIWDLHLVRNGIESKNPASPMKKSDAVRLAKMYDQRGWRAWVKNKNTTSRIYETEAEKQHQVDQDRIDRQELIKSLYVNLKLVPDRARNEKNYNS